MAVLSLKRKLSILSDAAKYDASCASSGTSRRDSVGGRGVGSTEGMGICHAYAPDGRCISLLKILLTNFCVYDCAYCVNRVSSNTPRARFSVQEVVDAARVDSDLVGKRAGKQPVGGHWNSLARVLHRMLGMACGCRSTPLWRARLPCGRHAVALAAALFRKDEIEGDAVIAVASGGNVDPAVFRQALDRFPTL